MALRRHYLPCAADNDNDAGDTPINLARALWLAEYFHESNINGTAGGIQYAFTGDKP
ncbi:DUF6890 family protein [Serratia marcescens]